MFRVVMACAAIWMTQSASADKASEALLTLARA